MRKDIVKITTAGCATFALAILAATPAAAIDPLESDGTRSDAGREVLFTPEPELADPESWFDPGHFHIAKKNGFGYTRRLKVGERSFAVGVRGPVLRKQKALGLAFRFRF